MIKILKNKEIKKQKPGLKLMPNHYHYISKAGRVWNSKMYGTAYWHGDWYKEKEKQKKQ